MHRRPAIAFAALAIACSAGPAFGAGLGTYENGSADIGRASAGRAAAAEDASTAWGNPAGMVLLGRSAWAGGAYSIISDIKFDPDERTDIDGGAGGNAGGLLPGLGSFYVHRVNDRLALGMSSVGLMGASIGYDSDWAGRYYSQEAMILVASVTPSFSLKINDWLSVGGGVSIGYGRVSSEMMLNNGGGLAEDIAGGLDNLQARLERIGDIIGGLPGWGGGWLPGGGGGRHGGILGKGGALRDRLEDFAGDIDELDGVLEDDGNFDDGLIEFSDDAWSVGGNFGILLQPHRAVRVGAVYRAPMEFTFKDTLRITDEGEFMKRLLDAIDCERIDMELTLRVPQEVMTSVVWEVTPAFALMGNVGWQNWEDIGDVKVRVDAVEDVNVSNELRMIDTWHFAIGARIRPAQKWTASVGWAYDTSAFELDARNPALPVDRQIRYSGGIQYDWSEKTTIGVGYTAMDMGRNSIDLDNSPAYGHLSGAYDKAWAHFVNLSLVLRF
ncbi:MAG: outer membrane protein transport protein [Verrucomicrobiae bacterium]|nr:outer membrane protein transport protein [Verrucomicrobiae bacterium]